MSYLSEYINCKVCGSDNPKFLGIRGNREHVGAEGLGNSHEHIVTNVVRCRKCSFVYTNPLIISKMDGYSNPDNYLSSNSVGPGALFKVTLNLIEKYAKKGRILDIGCGKGDFLSVAKKSGWETYGLEPSTNFAKFASEKYELNIKPFSLENANYPDCFFDAVTLNMVLEHIDDPCKLLSGIKKVLKKEGVLFIEVPNMDSLMLKAAALYFKTRGKDWSPLLSPLHPPFHSYGYNPASLRYLLTNQGFIIKKILIRDSFLRGFRSDAGGTNLEKSLRSFITKMAGLIGRGDVLILIAGKEP